MIRFRATATATATAAVLVGGADGGGQTFYARFGDVFGWACALATLAIWALWPRLRRRREKKRAAS